MQKQKTIAKWLAIILLLTLAIGCYLGLSAIVKTSNTNDNVAGADDTTAPPDIIIEPVYSSFPRRSEIVDGVSVQHIGGENEDTFLDVVYAFDNSIVIFSTKSCEYDVKSNGLYIARLQDNSLEEVLLISSEDEEYISSHPTRQGVLIATKSNGIITLRLYSSALKLIAQNTIQNVDCIKFYTRSGDINAILFDGSYLRHLSVDDYLNITYTTKVLEMDIDMLNYIISYGQNTLIFANGNNGINCITFSINNGFCVQNVIVNSIFCQLLPIFSSNNQYFVLLSFANNNYTLTSLSSNMQIEGKYTFSSESTPCITANNGGINLVTKDKIYLLCAHLDMLNSFATKIDEDDNVFSFKYFDGCNNLLIATGENFIKLYQLIDGKLHLIEKINCIPDVIKLVAKNNDTYTHSLYVSCNVFNNFAYMCFGKHDVFCLDLAIK